MRLAKTTLVCAIVGSVLFGVAGAFAAGMPAGGTVRLFVVPGQSQGQGTIVLTGAIGDYGKTEKVNNEGIGKLFLKKGTIEANLAAIQKKLNNSKPILNDKATCSYVFGATAPVKLVKGTGLYKGISGTVMLTETFAGVGPLYKTGKHKGQCNMSDNATPVAQWGSVQGVGTVKFS